METWDTVADQLVQLTGLVQLELSNMPLADLSCTSTMQHLQHLEVTLDNNASGPSCCWGPRMLLMLRRLLCAAGVTACIE
jgi:hypothetical protein